MRCSGTTASMSMIGVSSTPASPSSTCRSSASRKAGSFSFFAVNPAAARWPPYLSISAEPFPSALS